MTEELKPCPFCGEKEEVYSFDQTDYENGGFSMFNVLCNRCESSSGMRETEEEAIISWNRRASPWVRVEDENESPYCYPHRRFWIRLRDSTVTLDVSFDDSRGFIGPFRDYSLDSGEVTHWMPIPKLTEEE